MRLNAKPTTRSHGDLSDHERRLVQNPQTLTAGGPTSRLTMPASLRDSRPAPTSSPRCSRGAKANEAAARPSTHRTVAINAIQAPTASDLPQQWPKLCAAIGRLNIPPSAQDRWGGCWQRDRGRRRPMGRKRRSARGSLSRDPPKAAGVAAGTGLSVSRRAAPTRSGPMRPHEGSERIESWVSRDETAQ